jgi:histidinol-phosphate/aromatic aminotransferase/cobyric acid decarboxylase-like protein
VPRIDKANASENLSQRRLYLYAALAGAKVFPKEANFNLISAGEDDVVTRHHLDTELQKHQENL